MLNQLLPAAALAHKTHRHREYATTALPRLHGARRERFALAHVLDVVEDGDLGVAGEDEVAVHRVDGEGRGHSALCRGEALRYDGAAVDATRPGGVPERACVGEDVLDGGVSEGVGNG